MSERTRTTKPADGERAAIAGYSGQFRLAARVALSRLATIEWIRVADPTAGIADDFQFFASGVRHALQVKWSEHPSSFTWSDLVGANGDKPSLIAGLADAWRRICSSGGGRVEIHLCSNNYASTSVGPSRSALAACHHDSPKHLAAFLAQSFTEARGWTTSNPAKWDRFTEVPAVAKWLPAWEQLLKDSGLGPDEFVRFVSGLQLHLGLSDSHQFDELSRSMDRDVTELAGALQRLVSDRGRPVELTRKELLESLGWSSRVEYRNRHTFPVPTLYEANIQALASLSKTISEVDGGYLALLGPAGSGKSTLLAKLDFHDAEVVRYFAFVPDAADPLSIRGETASFLHDLSLALEEIGHTRVGLGADQPSQRATFARQLESAGRRWRDRGMRTIIVVDGLDHIEREQKPQRSLVDDLFGPSEIPDGVFVVLGTQTTAILPLPVAQALRGEGRTIEMSPLTDSQVGQLVDKSGIGEWLYPQQRIRFIEATEGHPLATTYLLEELKTLAEREPDADSRRDQADEILSSGASFGSSVARRYEGYYEPIRGDADLVDLLGVVSRLREPMDLAWIETWAPAKTYQRFTSLTEPLCRREGNRWTFIHNSFRLYLATQTATTSAGDEALHARLADLCARAGERWPEYAAEEAAQRFLAGDDEAVLRLVTPGSLRKEIEAFHPIYRVRQRLFVGLRSAARVDDRLTTIRLLLFNNELWQRGYVLEPGKLAKHLAITDSDADVRHVVGGRKLELDVPVALEIGAIHIRDERFHAAERIVTAVGGLAGILERSRGFNRSDLSEAVANWADVSCALSGVEATLDQIESHLPLQPLPSSGSDDEDWRASDERKSHNSARFAALARGTDYARSDQDGAALARLQEAVDADAELFWMARCRLVRALHDRQAGDDAAVLRHLRSIHSLATVEAPAETHELEDPGLPQWLLLRCAEVLLTSGLEHSELAIDFIELAGTVKWPEPIEADAGLDPYTTWLSKRRLTLMRGGQLTETPSGAKHDAGQTRLRRALDDLAALEVRHRRPSLTEPDHELRASDFDRIVRVIELPRPVLRDLRGSYTLFSAAQSLWSSTIAAAADFGGPEAVSFVLRQFRAAWDDPDRSVYWTPRYRMAVVKAVVDHGDSSLRVEAQQLLETIGELLLQSASDAYDRVDLLLDTAETWFSAGHRDRARALTSQAIEAAFSVGTHDDDRQLVIWLEWAVRAQTTGAISRGQFLETLHEFLHRILAVCDPGHVEADAAELLIREAWRVAPRFAADAAEQMVDAGVIAEAAGVAAVVSAAAADAGVSLQLVGAAAVAVLIPIAETELSGLTDALAKRSEEAGAADVIDRVEQAFQTWSLVPQAAMSIRSTLPDESSPVKPPHQLLAELRGLGPADEALPGADAFRRAVGERRSLDTATKLLREAERLHLGPECLGYCAAMVADEGDSSTAAAALRTALESLSARDWSRQWAGGARLSLMEAACYSGNDDMRAFAWADLASCVASEALTAPIYPREFLHLVQKLADRAVLGDLLPDIRSSMDRYIQAAVPPMVQQVEDQDSQSVLCEWFTRCLGHPSRDLDFGSRRVLAHALRLNLGDSQHHVARSLRSGGWAAEAALNSLLTVLEFDGLELRPELTEAVVDAAHSDDAIVRDLSTAVLERTGQESPVPPRRPLPVAYQLILPPAPERHAPELDRTGVPFIDMSDPQQVVAPFDLAIRAVAEIADVDEDVVLHRAAGLSAQCEDRWTSGGHRAFAERVHRRRQRLVYRPWAFMIGRRALGRVVAELHDGDLLPETATPAFALGVIDRRLIRLETLPLDSATPHPFRPADASDYSAQGWEADTQSAADAVAATIAGRTNFILGERSRWRLQLDDCPREQRFVRTFHGLVGSGQLAHPLMGGWESTQMPAQWYPNDSGLDFSRRELIVSGQEMSTDSPHMRWLALHPTVGRMMGWIPGHDGMSWFGADGVHRAWTEVRARGQIELKTRSGGSTAEVWRVVLGPAAKAELEALFGTLVRRLTVKRDRPREGTHDDWTEGTSSTVEVPHA